jgi:hypothetical protein
MLLLSTTALLTSPVEMPLLDSGGDRTICVHAQLDSSECFKFCGALWPHRPDVVLIKVCISLNLHHMQL